MTTNGRPFAIVTGASSGIGRELARLCAQNGYDLLIAADEPEIHEAAQELIPKILRTGDADERIRLHAELGRRLADERCACGRLHAFFPPDPECPLAVVADGDRESGDSFMALGVNPQGQASATLVRRVAA